MIAEEAAVGMRARYPRTGTTGRIMRLETIKGDLFAELDTTHLFYRIDQLVEAVGAGERVTEQRDDSIERLKKEREFLSDSGFQEALSHIDQSCEGGG
jgi:hypothetical protein